MTRMIYEAIVTEISTKPHPDADRVQLGDALGYQVVVGLDVQDGDIGVLFPEGGQLSHEFCERHSLYAKHPETGERMGGFFGKSRRVRAQRFRGEISEGFWAPLSHFENYATVLRLGQRFHTLAGDVVCNKYITPATIKAMRHGAVAAKSARNAQCLPRHYDTCQLRENYKRFKQGSTLYITEKLHGTSARSGYVRNPRRGLFGRLFDLVSPRWTKFGGTRNCILDSSASGEKGQPYRRYWHHLIANNLRRGEVVYYELVGYDTSGRTIMPEHGYDTTDLPDGEVAKLSTEYGGAIRYTYTCKPGESQAYIYRITMDGKDLHVQQVFDRTLALGVPLVPIIWIGCSDDFTMDHANELTRGPTLLGSTCIKEGICVREETDDGDVVRTLKHKSWIFCALEGIRRNDPDYIDPEEAS